MEIAKLVDHTMLKADATSETIKRYCSEAKEYGMIDDVILSKKSKN